MVNQEGKRKVVVKETRSGQSFVVWVVCLLVATVGSLHGETLPFVSIKGMTMKADVILAGEVEGEDEVRIKKIFHSVEPTLKEGGIMVIPSIPVHSRTMSNWFVYPPNAKDRDLKTKELVLFLKSNQKGVYEPIHFIGEGSKGLIWFNNDKCFGYYQISNPGGYSLIDSGTNMGGLPKGKGRLWEKIESGLKNRLVWESIKGINNPRERARKLADILVGGKPVRSNFEGANILGELKRIGRVAVPEIAAAMGKLQPDDDIAYLSHMLKDLAIGVPAEDRAKFLEPIALPLARWLETSQSSDPYHVFGILRWVKDPRAAEATRRFLKHKEKRIRGEAAIALGSMGDKNSFSEIAGLLVRSNEKNSSDYDHYLAWAIFQLNPEKARPFIEMAASREGNESLVKYISGYKKK